MQTVTVKNVEIGKGRPKICVPIVGKTATEILTEASYIATLEYDVLEWRIDHFEQVEDLSELEKTAQALREVLPITPILLTFRTKQEGGVRALSAEQYFAIYRHMIPTGLIDLIDIELFMDETEVASIIEYAHTHNVKVIMCNHDFDKTPDQAEIVKRLCMMQEKNADICKIAVMPQSAKDVLTLLNATEEMYSNHANRPLITMSMGGQGMVSRLCGEVFGSSLTFGAATTASAPGQIAVKELKEILELFNTNL